jgi:hypothetical protein
MFNMQFIVLEFNFKMFYYSNSLMSSCIQWILCASILVTSVERIKSVS